MLRFREFPKPNSLEQLQKVLAEGRRRIELLQAGQPDWHLREGTTIRGYVSAIDGSVQPYALTLPAGVDPANSRRWPLYVVLHGRADDMNEVNFISRMDGRGPGASKDDRPGEWIQLDVYGRGNNAYRWAGETDVFEAMAAVRQRFRIDEDKIVLHGFSMGGAGAWHLGLHHSHLWCSVGVVPDSWIFTPTRKRTPNPPLIGSRLLSTKLSESTTPYLMLLTSRMFHSAAMAAKKTPNFLPPPPCSRPPKNCRYHSS
jgi:pimeloyl-ACP methyl ester carboxylesterase